MQTVIPWQKRFHGHLLLLPAAMAAALVLYATAIWGPGLANDSFSYLTSARNLTEGKGLVIPHVGRDIPLTAWPPLLPVAISLLTLAGMEIHAAARILNVLLLAANVFLASRLIKISTASLLPALTGGTLLALSPTLLRAHSHVWSEPLFFLLYLVGLSILERYCRKPSLLLAVLFGLSTGLSCLARYAGLTMALTGTAVILLLIREKRTVKARHCIFMLLPALLPVVLWFFRNMYLTDKAAHRRFIFRWPTLADISQVLGDVSLWILPKAIWPTARAAALAVAGLALVWLAIVVLRRHRQYISTPLPLILIVFAVCYEAFIAVASLLADSAILAEERIQLPILIAAIIFIFSAVPRLSLSKPALRTATGLAIVFVALSLGRGLVWAGDAHLNGQSFSSAKWAASPTVQQVRLLPSNAQIFSNSPQLIYAQTGRIVWRLPSRIGFTRLPNENFETDMARLRQHINQSGGIMVVFRGLPLSHPLLESDIEANIAVRRIFDGFDGVIFAPAE
ncbi:MAG TPA: hypothetical protein VLH60_07155 [Sedimentisphaerales bacterium]|nr:hypothetical protein [Sedimentisphaerales bacterium]